MKRDNEEDNPVMSDLGCLVQLPTLPDHGRGLAYSVLRCAACDEFYVCGYGSEQRERAKAGWSTVRSGQGEVLWVCPMHAQQIEDLLAPAIDVTQETGR